jgi:hypothetical protein
LGPRAYHHRARTLVRARWSGSIEALVSLAAYGVSLKNRHDFRIVCNSVLDTTRPNETEKYFFEQFSDLANVTAPATIGMSLAEISPGIRSGGFHEAT